MPIPRLKVNEIVLKIAMRIEDLATEQDRIPFLSGDLRKSIQHELIGPGVARVGSHLPYARAVHDGRPAMIIYPNVRKNPPYGFRRHRNPRKARLKFTVGGHLVFARSVRQRARKGKPFLREAIQELKREGFGWLKRDLIKTYGAQAVKGLPKRIIVDIF